MYRPQPVILELGEAFFDAVQPAKFPQEILRFRNDAWAERVGLGALTEREWQEHFAKFKPLAQNLVEPLALRYHGHQFGSYNPQLGDGRGFLFAQLSDRDGRLLDLGTKGSGQTPYSRAGDGRLTLKGAVREVLATEMLEALGVNTSKTFSVFETGEKLQRNDEPSPTRSAVLVRLNHSHIRFGTFQRLAYFKQREAMLKLVAWVNKYYFAKVDATRAENELSDADVVCAFLREATQRSARLAGQWMIAGFVHGVLNTDNMNITGESFDYGPYRFLPVYDPGFTAAYFDHSGLYAYGRQPEVVLWNLHQLAEALTLIAPVGELHSAMANYGATFNEAAEKEFFRRLGLLPRDPASNEELMLRGFQLLAESQAPFERLFFDFYAGRQHAKSEAERPLHERFRSAPEALRLFAESLSRFQKTASAGLREQSDYFRSSQPCTLLIDEIERIWECIAQHDDWQPFHRKIQEIRTTAELFRDRR